jgi:hypothetical protein
VGAPRGRRATRGSQAVHHPEVGLVSLTCEVLLTPDADLALLVLFPTEGTAPAPKIEPVATCVVDSGNPSGCYRCDRDLDSCEHSGVRGVAKRFPDGAAMWRCGLAGYVAAVRVAETMWAVPRGGIDCGPRMTRSGLLTSDSPHVADRSDRSQL